MIKKGFIRVKKIKDKRYAYYVVNRWYKNKGPRQKVKGYLGRVVQFDSEVGDFLNDKDIDKYVKEHNKETIITDLIEFELKSIGFKLDSGKLVKDSISFDISKHELWRDFKGKKKNIVIEMNEGFMCNKTLYNLYKFKPGPDKNHYLLAKAFLEAGIKIPETLFVAIYDKFF